MSSPSNMESTPVFPVSLPRKTGTVRAIEWYTHPPEKKATTYICREIKVLNYQTQSWDTVTLSAALAKSDLFGAEGTLTPDGIRKLHLLMATPEGVSQEPPTLWEVLLASPIKDVFVDALACFTPTSTDTQQKFNEFKTMGLIPRLSALCKEVVAKNHAVPCNLLELPRLSVKEADQKLDAWSESLGLKETSFLQYVPFTRQVCETILFLKLPFPLRFIWTYEYECEVEKAYFSVEALERDLRENPHVHLKSDVWPEAPSMSRDVKSAPSLHVVQIVKTQNFVKI